MKPSRPRAFIWKFFITDSISWTAIQWVFSISSCVSFVSSVSHVYRKFLLPFSYLFQWLWDPQPCVPLFYSWCWKLGHILFVLEHSAMKEVFSRKNVLLYWFCCIFSHFLNFYSSLSSNCLNFLFLLTIWKGYLKNKFFAYFLSALKVIKFPTKHSLN